jgi:hypothetical protein
LTTIWRQRISGIPIGAPVVDRRGHLVVATRGGGVVQLSRNGDVMWQRDVGAPLVGGPLLGAEGRRYVMTTTATLMAWDASGRKTLDATLSTSTPPGTPPSMLPDGSLVVAIGPDLLWIEPDGRRRALARLRGPVQSLAVDTGRIVALLQSGDVYEWRTPGPPRRVTSLRGRPTAPAVLTDSRVATVIDGRDLVAVDLASGIRTVLLGATPQSGLVQRDGTVLTVAPGGAVRAFGPDGRMDRSWTAWTGTLPTSEAGRTTLLPGAEGRVLLVAPSRGIAALGAEGEVRWAPEAPCRAPSVAAAVPPHAVAVLCDDGTVAVMGEPAKKTQPADIKEEMGG